MTDLSRQSGADTYLRCTVCGRTSTTGFASSLKRGWEKCCGYTMRLVRTEADVERAVGQIAGPGARFPGESQDG
jgi:hypothetical protein